MTLSSTPHSRAADDAVSYDPAAVERKWQERWQARGTNSPDLAEGAWDVIVEELVRHARAHAG